MKLNVFSYDGNLDFVYGISKVVNHGFPVGEIRFRTGQLQGFAHDPCQMFFFHGQGCFVEVFYVNVL